MGDARPASSSSCLQKRDSEAEKRRESIRYLEYEPKIVESTSKSIQAEPNTVLKMKRTMVLTNESKNNHTNYPVSAQKHKNAPSKGENPHFWQ